MIDVLGRTKIRHSHLTHSSARGGRRAHHTLNTLNILVLL